MAEDNLNTNESAPPPVLATSGNKGGKKAKGGIYVTPAGLGTAEVRVFVVGEGENGGANLSRTKDGPPFVTDCPHSDTPLEGYWTSD